MIHMLFTTTPYTTVSLSPITLLTVASTSEVATFSPRHLILKFKINNLIIIYFVIYVRDVDNSLIIIKYKSNYS